MAATVSRGFGSRIVWWFEMKQECVSIFQVKCSVPVVQVCKAVLLRSNGNSISISISNG